MSTKECTTELKYLKHHSNDIEIPDAYARTKIYNNNKSAVQWTDSLTSKGIKHLKLIENMVYECHQSKYVDFKHIPGIINPSDMFTN